jgi:hypothetical protein
VIIIYLTGSEMNWTLVVTPDAAVGPILVDSRGGSPRLEEEEF